MLVFFLVLGFFVLIGIGSQIQKANKVKQTLATISRDFKMDEVHVSDFDTSVLGICFRDKTVLLGDSSRQVLYPWAKVVSVEVVRDGVMLNQTNRGSQVGGALVGGVILGPLGALVGGLSGSSTGVNRVKELALRIIVDDTVRPLYVVNFYQDASKKGSAPDGLLVTPHRERLERMHAHMVNALRQAQTDTRALEQRSLPSLNSSQPSLDRLQTLWDLKEKGALTDAEFQQQKALLLQTGGSVSLPLPSTAEGPKAWRVLLVSPGSNKIATIKAVREVTSLGLAQAKSLVDSPPQILKETSSEIEADRIKRRFDGIAPVRIEEHSQ
jgi:ribosomal protein L7/L12